MLRLQIRPKPETGKLHDSQVPNYRATFMWQPVAVTWIPYGYLPWFQGTVQTNMETPTKKWVGWVTFRFVDS